MFNKKLTQSMDKTFYPKFKDNWDNDIFRELTLPYLDPQKTILLDLGAGRGSMEQMDFKNLVKSAVGVDPQDAVYSNPHIHEAHVGFGDAMPFLQSNRFDVVVSNNVLEHIEQPDKFFAEVNRVIKTGGVFITKTPNRYHYIILASSLTPTSFHKWYNKMRGRPEEDTFPTRYEANTRTDQRKYAERNGFKIDKFTMLEGRPEYLRFNFVTYTMGIVYERFINLLGLDTFKIVIFSVFRKI